MAGCLLPPRSRGRPVAPSCATRRPGPPPYPDGDGQRAPLGLLRAGGDCDRGPRALGSSRGGDRALAAGPGRAFRAGPGGLAAAGSGGAARRPPPADSLGRPYRLR
eukprot:1658496-Alexandrium_andersonii.AAC.1